MAGFNVLKISSPTMSGAKSFFLGEKASRLKVISVKTNSPVANIVYFQGIRGGAGELRAMKGIMRRHANLYYFEFDYENVQKILPLIQKFILSLAPNGLPLIFVGLSIGGACAIILGKKCGADIIMPINSFYTRKSLFEEKNLGRCPADLHPNEFLSGAKQIIFVYSEGDTKVPTHNSVRLFREFSGKKSIHALKNAGHSCRQKIVQKRIAKLVLDSIKKLD